MGRGPSLSCKRVVGAAVFIYYKQGILKQFAFIIRSCCEGKRDNKCATLALHHQPEGFKDTRPCTCPWGHKLGPGACLGREKLIIEGHGGLCLFGPNVLAGEAGREGLLELCCLAGVRHLQGPQVLQIGGERRRVGFERWVS